MHDKAKTFNEILDGTPLEGAPAYVDHYAPHLLYPIPRKTKRAEIGILNYLPFHGVDIWNAYELSWLNCKGKPQIAIGEFSIPCTSPCLVESKSLKLYFNSFNQTTFTDIEAVKQTLTTDLSKFTESPITVNLYTPQSLPETSLKEFHAHCIDHLEIETSDYHVNPNLLVCRDQVIEEGLYSNLLKSNCLVTRQPDWGSVYIHYKGPRIEHASLLKYLISFRQHYEFDEHCIERIFMDLLRYCRSEKLTVFGKYTRRGGLDINPFRSNFESCPHQFVRTPRQ